MVGQWNTNTCKLLTITKSSYSLHSFRHSAATALVDNGCTITNLKRHGRWISNAVEEGYMKKLRPMKMNQLLLLSQAHVDMSVYPRYKTNKEEPSKNHALGKPQEPNQVVFVPSCGIPHIPTAHQII